MERSAVRGSTGIVPKDFRKFVTDMTETSGSYAFVQGSIAQQILEAAISVQMRSTDSDSLSRLPDIVAEKDF